MDRPPARVAIEDRREALIIDKGKMEGTIEKED